jgi:gas vesicle protein
MNDHAGSCTSPLSLLLYFLAGGVTGASVALLLAPQSGRATREKMRRRVSDAAGSVRDFKDQLVRQGLDIRDEVGHRVDEAVSALSGDEAKLPL